MTQQSWTDAIAAITEAQITDARETVVANLADRARYEFEENPENDSIQQTLTGLHRKFQTDGVLRSAIVAGLDLDVFNKQEVKAKKRNVYALQKLRDLLYAATTGHFDNAVNIATLKSLKALDGQYLFTGLVARACASDKVAVDKQVGALLSRHTMSEASASTQSSSTMTALEDLGVVKNVGSRQHPVYALTWTPMCERLMAIV